jgi:hypothetical protein
MQAAKRRAVRLPGRAERVSLSIPMAKTDSRNLRGDALAARAAKLGIALEDFRDADGSIRELDLQRRVSELERYSADFRFDKVLAVCVAAFGICGVATWLAMHFLWHPY